MFLDLLQQAGQTVYRAIIVAVVVATVAILASCAGKSYSLIGIAAVLISALLMAFLKGVTLSDLLQRSEPPPPRMLTLVYTGTFASAANPAAVAGDATLTVCGSSRRLRLRFTGDFRADDVVEAPLSDDGTLPLPDGGGAIVFSFDELSPHRAAGTYSLTGGDSGTFELAPPRWM